MAHGGFGKCKFVCPSLLGGAFRSLCGDQPVEPHISQHPRPFERTGQAIPEKHHQDLESLRVSIHCIVFPCYMFFHVPPSASVFAGDTRRPNSCCTTALLREFSMISTQEEVVHIRSGQVPREHSSSSIPFSGPGPKGLWMCSPKDEKTLGSKRVGHFTFVQNYVWASLCCHSPSFSHSIFIACRGWSVFQPQPRKTCSGFVVPFLQRLQSFKNWCLLVTSLNARMKFCKRILVAIRN